MFYITGDRHGDFENEKWNWKGHEGDTLIVLGDAGLNYDGSLNDMIKKDQLNRTGFITFCIHGNHENRPQNIESYYIEEYCGGKVYVEKDFPNLKFAIDGEVYKFGEYECLVIGGAYSVDKPIRLEMGWRWFSDEQPSDEIKNTVENKIADIEHRIDIVLTHTCPLKYEPREWFLRGLDQSEVDKSTEKWLGEIEKRLIYKKWYCGHFHGEKSIDRIRFLYKTIEELSI